MTTKKKAATKAPAKKTKALVATAAQLRARIAKNRPARVAEESVGEVAAFVTNVLFELASLLRASGAPAEVMTLTTEGIAASGDLAKRLQGRWKREADLEKKAARRR